MKDNLSEFYDFLRYAWYLLIAAVLYGLNGFYQYYFDSLDRFIYFKLIAHYCSVSPGAYPLHFIVSSLLCVGLTSAIVLKNPFQILYDQNRLHGSARFAGKKEIEKLGLLKAKGTVLCQWKSKTLYVSDPLSILLLAPPGTGKSAGVAIPTLFYNPHSIIALDVKKELFQITSKYRHTFSHVMIFEPTSDRTSCWNPLDQSILPHAFAEVYVRVQQIASNIFIKSESTSDPYWIDSARELFINIAMGLIERDGGTSIPAVYEASLGDGNISRKDCIADLGETQGLYEPVAKKLSAYRHTADQQFSGTLGTFDTGLMSFQDPRVKNAVSKCDIKFKDLRGIKDENGIFKPVTLYLVIKPIDVERLSPLIRVFFESLSKYLLSTSWDKSTEHMITFLLDEFPRLGKMEDIIKMPALSRGQGVNSILIAQDAGQIERVYQKSGREEIMSTTAYKVIPSQNSFESAKLISDSIGDMTIRSNSSSHQNTDFIKSSVSRREQGRKLLTPQHIMSLSFGKCYVISQFAAETPIKGKLYLWFKDKALTRLAGELKDDLIYRPENSSQQSSDDDALNGVELPSDDIIDQFYNPATAEKTDSTERPQVTESEDADTDSSCPDVQTVASGGFSVEYPTSPMPEKVDHDSLKITGGQMTATSDISIDEDLKEQFSFSNTEDEISKMIIEDSLSI